MAFIVEDGTPLSDSTSYVAVPWADEYHADRGHEAWDLASGAQKQAALIRATDYIDKRWGRRFRGYRQTPHQALEWPRFGVTDNDGWLVPANAIPSQIQKACSEYALRALSATTLAPDNFDVGLRALREKVGPIETDKRVDTARRSGSLDPTSIPDYPEADLWVQELLRSTASRELARG